MFARTLLASAIAALALGSTVDANGYAHSNKTHYKGFNTGSTFNNYTNKYQADYEAEFLNAKALQGGNGTFTSQRLYTMIQAGTQYDPIQAIPAAITTNTTLLLGLWASQNQDGFNLELAALNVAIETYGQKFLDLVVGISVGSEDLYRITPTGIENMSGVGQSPDVLVQYITEVRGVLANNGLYNISVGHVDTWTAWVNNSNAAVIDACDFIGYDGYPYFEVSLDNTIEHGATQFWTSYNATLAAVQARGGNQTVWVTETGWPLSGPTANAAVASTQNAEIYWQAVACELFRKNINTWWFTMWDSDPNVPSPSFGLVGQYLQPQPLINLTCAY